MRKLVYTLAATVTLGLSSQAALAVTPEEDLAAFRAYFQERFPTTPFNDYINGVYSIDAASREQWEEIEDSFPPYELSIENGETAFNTPFANGKSYSDCFINDGEGVRQDYPYFDTSSGRVITLESAINECRVSNGEKPLKYKKGEIANISAYMAYTSRGNVIDVAIPNDDAVAAYEAGKKHYYMKRGQLNLACADCHMYSAGTLLRTEKLSPSLGHVTGFPVYRSKWGELGTLHRRFGGCNEQVRAKAFKPQSDEYRNLEYYLSYMSNGLEVNGPSARK